LAHVQSVSMGKVIQPTAGTLSMNRASTGGGCRIIA
jgi:hypothetical protein